MTSKAHQSSWQALVAAERHECEQKIPRDWLLGADQLALAQETPRPLDIDLPRRSNLLSDIELDLTEIYTATQLLGRLASGHFSSLAVTTAFCKRAAIAQQVVSAAHFWKDKEALILICVLCRPHVSQKPSFHRH